MDVILTGWDLCLGARARRLQQDSTVALIKSGLGAAFLSKQPALPRSNSAATLMLTDFPGPRLSYGPLLYF